MKWTTHCPDWEKRIIAGRSLIGFKPLFPKEARFALKIFKQLHIMDVQGCPTMGEACRKWIIDFVSHVFGSYDQKTGRRLIQEFFMLIAKKNSKSTTAAGIMLTALIVNWRSAAEFLILAPTVEIANNSYYPARDMIRSDEDLSDLFHVQDHIRTITSRKTGASLKVVAADADTVGGKKATGILVDELHLFGKQSNAANMLLEATGGLAARPEGFVIYLSTQSDTAPAGVFKQKLDYARGVRDGRIDDNRFLPVMYEFPKQMVEDKTYRDKKNFYMTNPNLGSSVDVSFLERSAKKSEVEGEIAQCIFYSKHLNVEIGLALLSDRWAGADYWEQQARQPFTLYDLIERSEVLTIGIDGGGLDDLLGLDVTGRVGASREWVTWTHAWAHESVLIRRKKEAARFKDFEKDGDLTIVERIGDDVLEVASIVAQVEQSGKLDKVGVDPAGIGSILDAMIEAGVPQEKVIGITQGWRMTGAIKTTERKLAEGGLIHGGQRMMNWCVSNAKVEPRGNAVIITKQAAGSAKIDPLIAMFNSVSLMALNPEAMGLYTGEIRMI